MVGLHFLIRFRSPPRAAIATNSWVPSDTLAAALGWAAGELGVYEAYARLLLSGGLVVTSVFPRAGSSLLWPEVEAGRCAWRCGQAVAGRKPHRLRCASVSRLTAWPDVFCREGVVWKVDGVLTLEAHFVVAVREGSERDVEVWVRVLADAGIGGGRAVGFGGFDVEGVLPGPVPADGGVLWSVAVPDGDAGFDRECVPWVRREGFHDGSCFGRGNVRKAGVLAVPEGVRVGPGFRGTVLPLDGERVLYCGAAFVGPVR